MGTCWIIESIARKSFLVFNFLFIFCHSVTICAHPFAYSIGSIWFCSCRLVSSSTVALLVSPFFIRTKWCWIAWACSSERLFFMFFKNTVGKQKNKVGKSKWKHEWNGILFSFSSLIDGGVRHETCPGSLPPVFFFLSRYKKKLLVVFKIFKLSFVRTVVKRRCKFVSSPKVIVSWMC